MADIPEGSFTHTLEEIDAATTQVENAKGQSESLSAAITSAAETAATTATTAAIGTLDVSSVGGSGKYISAISETDGKISATATSLATSVTDGGSAAVTGGAVYTALAGKASIADILGQGTSLVSGTNLDTLYEPGSYYTESINVSESLVNNPFPANRIKLIVFYLDGSGTSNARCTQIIFPQASTVYFFMRHCINGIWDAWTKFEAFGGLGQSLSNSVDVKGLAIGRYYKVSDAQTLINIPSDFTGGSCYIDVYNTIASSNKVIRLYPGSNSTAGCYYETVFSGGSWSSWYKYAGTAVS